MSETTQAINDSTMIEKFDPSKLMDGVKDRIKSTFVSLIPDGAWEAMVEKEIYIFTTGRIELKSEMARDENHNYIKDENGNYVYKYWEERKPYSGKDVYDNWGNLKNEDISPLQKMIRQCLREKFEEDLKKYLAGDEYQGVFDQYGAVKVGEAIEEVLIKNTDTIFKNFMASVMQKAFDQMRYSIGQGNY